MADKEKQEPVKAPEEELSTEDLIGNPQEDFDIDADLETLRKIDISKAILIKSQRGGKHPDKKIDGLLNRYMKFTPDEIEGPYLVRVLSTIMFIFIVSALSWLLIWVMGNVAGWSVFIRLLSIAMSTFVIAMFGVAIFNPMSLLNENDLQNKIKIRLEELHQSRQQDINREILGEESEPELDNKVASEVPVEKEDSLPEGETAVESSDGNDSEIPPIFPDNNSEDEKPV
jgi:hypothetical protein